MPGNEIVNCAAYTDGKRVGDVTLNEIHDVPESTDQFVLIGLHDASWAMLEKVQDSFNLHKYAVEDALGLPDSAMGANFSLVNIDQRNVSRKFTTWAAINAVPTMIDGLYGMNFQFMHELQWQYGYYIVILLTFSICSTLYYFFRKADWL